MDYREDLLKKTENGGNTVLDDEELLDFSKKFMVNLESENVESFKLYRYVPFNYNNLRSIETGRVYLSELGKMNDIFEGLTLAYPTGEVDLHNLHDLAYMKAFSEEKSNLLMWSHYGDNHKGLCVEYDLKQLNHYDKCKEKITDDWKALYHLFPILYLDTRINNSSALNSIKYAAKSIEEYKFDLKKGNIHEDYEWHQNIKSLLLVKSKEWAYEKEWRLVLTFHQLKGCSDDSLDNKTELYELNEQNISFDCISSIYCGVSLSQDQLEQMKEMVIRINEKRKGENRRQIELYRCSLNPEAYKLDEKVIDTEPKVNT